jgi:hypothetical protein
MGLTKRQATYCRRQGYDLIDSGGGIVLGIKTLDDGRCAVCDGERVDVYHSRAAFDAGAAPVQSLGFYFR